MPADAPPLGSAQSQDREFERAAVLDTSDGRHKIGRAVVAMLNARPGTVWIGIVEQHEHAVQYEDIPEAGKQATRLHDYFMDALEPAPLAGEVRVLPVAAGHATLLRVDVRGEEARRPYALRRGAAAREYYVRVGARVRPMTLAELRDAFGQEPAPEADERGWSNLMDKRERLAATGFAGLCVRFQPLEDLRLPLDEIEPAPLFRDASRTGNRDNGWNFVNPYSGAPELTSEGVRFRWRSGEVDLRVSDEGSLDLQVALERLRHDREGTRLYPLALIEQAVAAARLFRVLVEAQGIFPRDVEIVLDLALIGARGWTLGPFSPRAAGYRLERHRPCPGDVVGIRRPVRFTVKGLLAGADEVMYSAIRQIYRAFGYGPEAIPVEYDATSHRLLLE